MADYASLHCASCRTDICYFVNEVYYPGCRHVFCPNCFNAYYRAPTGKFQCPIDFVICASQSEYSQQFFQALQLWWSVKNNMSPGDVYQCYQMLLQCVNLTLFPCVLKNYEHNLDWCPFDHSLQSTTSQNLPNPMNYCKNCKICTKVNNCPRCRSNTERKEVAGRVKMTVQPRVSKPDWPLLKTIGETQSAVSGNAYPNSFRGSKTIVESPAMVNQRRQ